MKRIAALIFALVVALCSVTAVFAAGYGDTNGNGKVDIIDVTTIERHIARIIEISDEAIDLSDVDGDGITRVIVGQRGAGNAGQQQTKQQCEQLLHSRTSRNIT